MNLSLISRYQNSYTLPNKENKDKLHRPRIYQYLLRSRKSAKFLFYPNFILVVLFPIITLHVSWRGGVIKSTRRCKIRSRNQTLLSKPNQNKKKNVHGSAYEIRITFNVSAWITFRSNNSSLCDDYIVQLPRHQRISWRLPVYDPDLITVN